MGKEKAIFAWSGGKDSSLALYKTLQEGKYEIVALLTTLNRELKRISMHGVRQHLLEEQAKTIGIPLLKVWIDEASYTHYEKQMETALLEAKAQGVTTVIFGDIFLEDLREYRENNLKKVNMKAYFPLWKKDTHVLIQEFIDLKFKTITCCINDGFFDESFVGEIIDESFVTRLPKNVDPCGEYGEFHSFCFDGPLFKRAIHFKKGEKVYKPLDKELLEEASPTKGFWYCELIPMLVK